MPSVHKIKMNTNIATRLKAKFKWVQITSHVLHGVIQLVFLFPISTQEKNKHRIKKWSQKLLSILQVELEIEDEEYLIGRTGLVVSNHISWLDIHVINSHSPMRFVAKREVANWPVFGFMAKRLSTIFINRDSARNIKGTISEISEILKIENICIFPEGTSTFGCSVKEFKSNLFEAALLSQADVMPISIQYMDVKTGERSYAPVYADSIGLLESISSVIYAAGVKAKISCNQPIEVGDYNQLDRKKLSKLCQISVGSRIQSIESSGN